MATEPTESTDPLTTLNVLGFPTPRYAAGDGAANQIPARRLMYTGSSKLEES